MVVVGKKHPVVISFFLLLMNTTTRSSDKRTSPQGSQPAKSPLARLQGWLACLAIVAAGCAAYCNSFDGPFIFDDDASILDNPTIKRLWPIGPVLAPPGGGWTVQCRPVVNLSLAINWAIGKDKVRGYHVLNLAIHLAAGLTLFGVVRQTLRQPRLVGRFAGGDTGIALVAALLWTVHPLQTGAVTYIVQRAESIMGLFYLLTLYGVIRGAGSAKPGKWYILCVLACLLGMASKEVMVTAPLVVLLYDRAFLAGTFKGALQRRWPLYGALACTWGLLAYLMAGSAGRGGSVGFGLSVTPWQYALTQLGVITHYLRLAFWPSGLVLDYGWPMASSMNQILPGAVVIGVLAAGTIWALIRNSAAGFLGASFFLILSPTSSFVPLLDAAFEHRMYLPLAAVVVLVVTGLYRAWQWVLEKTPQHKPARVMQALPLALPAMAAVALGYGTFERNKDYRSVLAIWQDTVAKRPDNPRPHHNLGFALAGMGRWQEAIPLYERQLQLMPDDAEAENSLGLALARVGRVQEAIARFERAVQLKPDYADAHSNLAVALVSAGRVQDANAHYERALQGKPEDAEVEKNLGLALARVGRTQEAIAHFERAAQRKTQDAEVENNLGLALALVGRVQEAIAHFERAVQLKPDYADAANSLGVALVRVGRIQEAIAHFERAVRLKPDYAEAENNLGLALARVGRTQEAIAHFERAVRLKPDYAEAHGNLARIRSSSHE
jgi:tetratricopeptide (TPR) repeat protein